MKNFKNNLCRLSLVGIVFLGIGITTTSFAEPEKKTGLWIDIYGGTGTVQNQECMWDSIMKECKVGDTRVKPDDI